VHLRNLIVRAVCLIVWSTMIVACSSGADDSQIRTKQSVPQVADISRLEQLAEDIPGVQHANCVRFGNTAIVGIDVAAGLDRSRVGTLKYAVAEALRNDPIGVNAVVTADLDIVRRLQEIGADIAAGRPVTGFAEELADIVGRIMPQLPKDIQPREDKLLR
jgi:YhcN/YlaJ family sporulation lipoprotein